MLDNTDLPEILTREYVHTFKSSSSGTLTAFYQRFGHTPNYKFTNFSGSLTFFNKDFIFSGDCSSKWSNNSAPFTWPVTIRYNERHQSLRITILDLTWEWTSVLSSGEVEVIYDVYGQKAFVSVLRDKVGVNADETGWRREITMRSGSSIVLD